MIPRVWFLLACAAPAPSDSGATLPDSGPADSGPTDTAETPAPLPTLAVSAYFSGAVYLFDRVTGERVGELPDVPGAQSVHTGPDGSWVVVAEEAGTLQHYAADGTALAPFAEGVPAPTAAVWGPDGALWAGLFDEDRVARYDADGIFLGDGVAAGAGGLDGPDFGLTFGPDGNLYVPGWNSDAVHVYAPDGTWLHDVVTAADGLHQPRAVRFDEDGRLWVTGQGSDNVLIWDGTGVTEFTSPRGPAGLVIDGDDVLIASWATETVRVYDRVTGEAKGVLIDDAAIDGITFLAQVDRAP